MNGNAWASAAEFSMVGCTDLAYDLPSGLIREEVTAYPVPSNGQVYMTIPGDGPYSYQIISTTGMVYKRGTINGTGSDISIDISICPPGLYIIQLSDQGGRKFTAKAIKK